MTAGLTEIQIQESASSASFRRGQEFHKSGAIIATTRDNDLLVAMVMEGMPPPFTVEIVFNADCGVSEADCPCSFGGQGWCPHIVAALLAHLENPNA